MIRGQEFHSIIQNIFGDVRGILQNEQLQVNCPRCQERDGLSHPDGKYNLEINTAKKMFRCWRCDEPKFSGSLGKLIHMYGSHMDYEMYKSYAQIYTDYNSDDEQNDYAKISLPEEMILFSEMVVNNPDHFEAYKYMHFNRKISYDLLLKFRIGFCVTGRYAKRIIIPSYDINGELNYFVGRSYDPKEKKHKYLNPPIDKNTIIFNEGLINWDSTIYLVEGSFEMLSFPVNSIPMLGKTIFDKLFLKLQELKPEVIILLDPDAYNNSIELFYKLKTIYIDCEEKVRLVKLPTNDDLDELRRNMGIDEVINCLYSARQLIVDDYFISKLQKPYDNKPRRYESNSKYFDWK